MKKLVSIFIFMLTSLLFVSQGFAAVWGELNGLYNSDSFLSSKNSTYSQMFYSADVFANLDSNYTMYAGFHIHQMSVDTSATGATNSSFSTMDMGPMFMWIMDRKRVYSLSANFNVVAKADNASTQTAQWDGMSYLMSFGITPEISEGWYVGFKLNYYSATYSRQTIGSASTDISNSRSMIFPTVVLSYRK